MNDEDWISFDEAVAYVEAKKQCYREKAIDLLGQAADSFKVRTRTVNSSPRWVGSEIAGRSVFHSDGGQRIEFHRKDLVALCESKSTPPKGRSRPISDGIRLAINALWPDGIPAGVRAKVRDTQILQWLKRNDKSISTNISRAVERVLKKPRDAS
jgi:hypothetical protein